MDIFQIVIFISIIIGIFLVIKGLFIFNKETSNYSNNDFETSNTIKFMESTLNEIDKISENFNITSKQIFSEMEEKYEELLFLYTLIDEKNNEKNVEKKYAVPKKDMAKTKENLLKNIVQEEKLNHPLEKPIKITSAKENPSSVKILEMTKQGLSISEMAKKLNIGQGEVKLILELGKNR